VPLYVCSISKILLGARSVLHAFLLMTPIAVFNLLFSLFLSRVLVFNCAGEVVASSFGGVTPQASQLIELDAATWSTFGPGCTGQKSSEPLAFARGQVYLN